MVRVGADVASTRYEGSMHRPAKFLNCKNLYVTLKSVDSVILQISLSVLLASLDHSQSIVESSFGAVTSLGVGE